MLSTRQIRRSLTLSFVLLLPAVSWLLADEFDASIARGDDAWARRSEGHQGIRAAAAPIDAAIQAYDAAVAADPENLEARWKLLRALYFKGEFVLTDRDARLELFERGRELADVGRQQLERTYGLPKDTLDMEPEAVVAAIDKEDVDAARIFFWSATHWGLWGRYRGKFAAARQGVATKIRKFAEIVIGLNPEIENAGGHRVLGRLHAEAPKIPFVTGWIDHDRAITELRQALEIAPRDLLAQVFLAEALLDFRPERRAEAVEILRRVVASEPDPEWLVEELKAIDDARVLLAERID